MFFTRICLIHFSIFQVDVVKTINCKTTTDQINTICLRRIDDSDNDLEMAQLNDRDYQNTEHFQLKLAMGKQKDLEERLAQLLRTYNDKIDAIRAELNEIAKQLKQFMSK